MILNDASLHSYASNGMVTPFTPQHVSPCSIDLTLGDKILIESLDQDSNGWVSVDITKPYHLRPGQFILATTAENITLPSYLSAQIILRSSAARAGWDHCLAGWIDPGWNGQITLELRNNRQLHNLTIQAGMRLVQLVCFELSSSAINPYSVNGNYQNQQGVTPSNLNLSSLSSAA